MQVNITIATTPAPRLAPPERPRDVALSGPPVDDFIVTADDPQRLQALKQSILERDPRARITHDLPIIHGFSVEVGPASAPVLRSMTAGRSGIHVHRDEPLDVPERPAAEPHYRPMLDTVGPTLGLEKLWSRGIKGKGVGIAIIDSGVAEHPDLKGRIAGFRDIEGNINRPHDENGHGTHVASIAAGSGRKSKGLYVGVAPEADIIGIKVTDEMGRGKSSDFIAGIQWAVDNRRKYHIGVMNLSFGHRITDPGKDDPTTQAVEAAVAAGIVACIAAGNKGPKESTVTAPGNAPSAITVGAFDDHGTPATADDTMAGFSGRGPTAIDGLAKPDLVAPGVDILAAHARSGSYIPMNGTSMASPVVAGTVALMLSVRPDLTPAQVKELLLGTARPLPGADVNAQGHGVVNPVEAVKSLAG